MPRNFYKRSSLIIFALWVWVPNPALACAQSSPTTQSNLEQAKVLYDQGMVALHKADLVAARSAFEKVVRLAPRNADAHNSLGWILLNQGAIEDRKSTRLNSSH